MPLHHIRKNIKMLETEIKSRGCKDNPVMLTILQILKHLNKEVEKTSGNTSK